MTFRHQLPVSSPITLASLTAGAWGAMSSRPGAAEDVAAALTERHGARRVVLTDSGTSALVLALRMLVGEGGTVALPGYACIDLTAAAVYAGVRVRLYDLDPVTLGPDFASLERAIERGVHAVVAAHLYGYPVDMDGVRRLADAASVPVIEDAAQGAGATLHGRLAGSFGALSVLSFGRGKGMTGGAGGALLLHDPLLERVFDHATQRLRPALRGAAPLAGAAAQWLLGRPSLYAIPSGLPMLRLGEMVYHHAHEPRSISSGAAAMLRVSLRLDAREIEHRRGVAADLAAAAESAGIGAVRPIPGAVPGYLRFPVVDERPQVCPNPSLGILRGYPCTLLEHLQLEPLLQLGERREPLRGSRILARALLTLPTHSLVRTRDRRALTAWIGSVQALTAGAAQPLSGVA